MTDAHRVFPWKRFWCRFGTPIHCGDSGQGFLTDPDDQFGRYFNKEVFSLEKIFESQFVVLCGEPAMGKTYSTRAFVESLRQKEAADASAPKLIHLEFRSIPDLATFKERCFKSAKWENWINAEGRLSLIVDGLDEGLIRIDRFLPFLTDELRQLPKNRLQLVLICRTLEWQRVEHQVAELTSFWRTPTSETQSRLVYTLCPLRQKDAELAANLCGIDAKEFIHAVYNRGVTSLAARPYTLKMLLREFSTNHALPNTRRELYEKFGLSLCSSEHDPERAEILRKVYGSIGFLLPNQLYRVASRLAALLLLGGKNAIHIGPIEEATASDLRLVEACGRFEETDGKAFSVDDRAILDTVATPVFTDRGLHRFGFDHQTMAECLAARHVQQMSLIQLREIFCQRDVGGESVVPQLAQTAAWLAETRDDFFEHLLHIDPETLLRSETTEFTPNNKRRLVERLLERAREEEAFDEFANYYSGLKHPELASQLRPYIQDRSLNLVVRRIALKIALECEANELFEDVLSLTSSRKDCHMLGSAIGHALEELAKPENVEKLEPLARGECAY